ncbi:hypothetical protein J6590_009779 [Homalodisca vitripennis]|nr:hypothetical protein J6590_009779 [Homalodisca vitripennis]
MSSTPPSNACQPHLASVLAKHFVIQNIIIWELGPTVAAGVGVVVAGDVGRLRGRRYTDTFGAEGKSSFLCSSSNFSLRD